MLDLDEFITHLSFFPFFREVSSHNPKGVSVECNLIPDVQTRQYQRTKSCLSLKGQSSGNEAIDGHKLGVNKKICQFISEK